MSRPYHHMEMIWVLVIPVVVSILFVIAANLIERVLPKREPRPEKRGFEVLPVTKTNSSR